MKHRSKKKILSRKKAAKKSLLKSLASSLVIYEKIKTTEAKAKVLRPVVEKLITKGKKNNLTIRRQLLDFLRNEKAVNKILEVLSPKYKERKGGYLQIIKVPNKRKDAAKTAIIKFVEDNEPETTK